MNNSEMLKNRFKELSHRAYECNYCTFTNFLNLDEISTLLTTDIESKFKLYGGYDNSERCICCFFEMEDEVKYPIDCICISPLNPRFTEKLTHRDYLGALMNLGIEREMLGDIKLSEDKAYLFCVNKISEYIISSLNRVKNTSVKCNLITEIPELFNTNPQPNTYIISSERIDVVVCAVFNQSRTKTSKLISNEKVFVNSAVTLKESYLLKCGDIISVRGLGKFIYYGTLSETRKGKKIAEIGIYK